MTRRWLSFLAIILLSLSALAARPAQASEITYQRYDVTIQLLEDGSFKVRETYVLRFDASFTQGFAEIPLAYTESVEVENFYEDDTPYVRDGSGPGSYTVSQENGSYYVEWTYTPTAPGEVRTFSLDYRVTGGLWVYPDGQILRWRAVPADRSGIPIEASQVRVILPASISLQDVMALSGGVEASLRTEGQQLIYAAGPISDGDYLQVEVTLPPNTLPIQPPAWQQAEDESGLDFAIERWDVTLSLAADGSVLVEERQQINVRNGALYGLDRTLSHRFVDAVEVLGVWEGDLAYQKSDAPCEGCYQVISEPTRPGWVYYESWSKQVTYDEALIGRTQVRWDFPPLRGQRTTFILRYRLRGALRITPEAQALVWQAVTGEGRKVPVEAAQVQVVLPPGVSPNQVTVSGGAVSRQTDGTLLITCEAGLDPGESWEVSLTLPPQATSATKAAWQEEVEAVDLQAQAARKRQAWIQIGTAVSSFLLLIGGLGGALLAWYLWGRDAQVGAIADVLPRPPSDLPPGIVAYLLKEEATVKGALATLFHLANLGLLTISFKGKDLFLQCAYQDTLNPDMPIQLNAQETVRITPHMATLFNALRPHIAEGATLSQIYPHFLNALPKVYEQMGEEAGQFFAGRPDRVRRTWQGLATLVLLGGLLILCLGTSLLGQEAGMLACFPGVAIIIGSLGLFITARWMPRRTAAGALEAAKWRAFQRFLQDLKRYGDLPNAQYMLDRYFAYAVALEVEEVLIHQAVELGARLPVWTLPTIIEVHNGTLIPRRIALSTADGALPSATDAATPTPPSRPDFSLQSVSDGLIRAINNASSGLSAALSNATSTPGAPSTQADLDRILRSASGGGSSGYRSTSRTSWSSSRSSWSSGSSRSSWSSHSSRSSSFGGSHRSSSSSHSGGGGRRGFR